MQVGVDLTRCLSTEKSWTPSACEPRQQFPSSRANCWDRTLNSVDTTPVGIVPPHGDRNLAAGKEGYFIRTEFVEFLVLSNDNRFETLLRRD